MSGRSTSDLTFEGFVSPGTTPVPDAVFDELLPHLSEAELKVLLYIIRRTYGFAKEADRISFSQFLHGITLRDGRRLDGGCGLSSRASVWKGLRSLEQKGIVLREKASCQPGKSRITVFRLRMGAALSEEEMVHKMNPHGSNNEPPLVQNMNPQETEKQETERQETDPSKFRMASNQINECSKPIAVGASPAAPAVGASPAAPAPRQSGSVGASPAVPTRRPAPASPESEHVWDGHPAPATNAAEEIPLQKHCSAERRQMLAFIRDFAIELHDEAPLVSSVSRALRLFERSGLTIDEFCECIYEARALTQEHSASIKKHRPKRNAYWPADKNKMPYFFAILERIAHT